MNTNLILAAEEIKRIKAEKGIVTAAIDGRCAAGKTTLAKELQRIFNCTLIHTDDFFLRPEQRTKKRYSEPGGNLDRERLSEEVLNPLLWRKSFLYRPFDCRTMSLCEAEMIMPTPVVIVEGTYSCHPELRKFYDIMIFMTLSEEKQKRRLKKREKSNYKMFEERWIPLEEQYFKECEIEKYCSLKLFS